MIKIYIDIGHGEHGDPGAVKGNFIEHQINVVLSSAMGERLIEHGYQVKLEQGNLEIGDSARMANRWGANLLISNHENAGGGNRGEVIYAWKKGSNILANAVASGLRTSGQDKVNIVRCVANTARTAEKFGILRISTMPAVISGLYRFESSLVISGNVAVGSCFTECSYYLD